MKSPSMGVVHPAEADEKFGVVVASAANAGNERNATIANTITARAATMTPRIADQKSRVAACGTSMSLPGYQARFSAHSYSDQSALASGPPAPYVMVAVHGVVNTVGSSTVN